ncbi:MAG TPA: hypothetical protein VM450_02845 [Thermomicrobiales bacterium]|nr:hypothetical protein [Thermomicrobiales bacterium]
MVERIRDMLGRIPGYNGYRDKENRRDEDRRLRESIADAIMISADQLTQYNARLSANRELSSLSRVEAIVGQIRLLADRVRTASYGYGGIFTERSVDEAALDQLRQFDLALQREVQALGAAVSTLTASTPPSDANTSAVTDELGRLNLLFDSRTSVVDEGKPTREARVLDLLDTTPPPKPSPLMSVNRGDALSVLGDNFVADATISLATDDGPLQLIRVAQGSQGATWLLGSGVPGIISARLTEVTSESTPSYQTMNRATATIDTEKGRQEGVAAQYAAQTDNAGSLQLTLLIGDEPQVFRGNEIRDIDVEIYGAA